MSDLTVSPWKRHGKDRLYVNLPNGDAVAWADRATKVVTIKNQKYQDEALALLGRHLGEGVTVGSTRAGAAVPVPEPRAQQQTPSARRHPSRPASLPPLSPDEDLAELRPGAGILRRMAERGPSTTERWVAKLLRRSSDWDSWYTGLEGERRVGRELKRLAPLGWRALHGIQKSSGGDIDHLLIGPGGVFSINTKTHRGASVWVGDAMVKVNGGKPHPYAAASKAEAEYVRGVLGRYCCFYRGEVEPRLRPVREPVDLRRDREPVGVMV
ncbi:nuclease-related domain-containing protein, partial [Streptomyces gardneri]|uniref:nuclease-related domain-containing protein n=1 Tax=Streptomyces gardneri TaxID=66892 RepID=UPI0036D060DA